MSDYRADPGGIHGEHGSAQTSFWKSKAALVAGAFLLIGAFFLLTEHWAHVLGVLPYLLILACPLMHIFMHHGHRGHRGQHANTADRGKTGSGADS